MMKPTTLSPAAGAAVHPDVAAAGPFGRLPATLAPNRALLVYYTLRSLLTGPAFPFVFIAMYFRYHTLRYQVDAEGITMRWGVLFRREVSLTYARIQDIHLSSNVVERWLGLGRIQVQTASGTTGAEMTIEGLREFEAIRDYLYSRMRGARDLVAADRTAEGGAALPAGTLGELTSTLREIAAEVRALRESMAVPAGREGDDARADA